MLFIAGKIDNSSWTRASHGWWCWRRLRPGTEKSFEKVGFALWGCGRGKSTGHARYLRYLTLRIGFKLHVGIAAGSRHLCVGGRSVGVFFV